MNAVAKSQSIDSNIIANLVTTGDLSRLSAADKVSYYNYRCEQAGLDPAAQPFSLLKLNGKEILYANASCAHQLCGIHGLTTAIVSKDRIDGIYIVQAKVTSPDGRSTENTGAVSIDGLKGEALSNALMKACTKSIRRTVLAHLGLGMLDETEVDTIPGAQKMGADIRPEVEVDSTLRDKHVSAIADLINQDLEEKEIARHLQEYVAEFLQGFNELYISVADELSRQKVLSKDGFRKFMKMGTTL